MWNSSLIKDSVILCISVFIVTFTLYKLGFGLFAFGVLTFMLGLLLHPLVIKRKV